MTGEMRRIVLASRPSGAPSRSNFRLESAAIPAPGPGEILVKTLYLSLDPYMRGRMDDGPSYAAPVAIGDVMEGGVVGAVIASRHPRFQPGDIAQTYHGWASHGVSAGDMARKIDPDAAPISTALGVLGMPGLTGYHGLTAIGQPKAGETIVVSAATGAVGSLVGQLAKLRGLRVVGVAGGAEKGAYARDALGFDACVDHRAAPDARALRAALAAACPDGVDIYFENVGGKTLEAVLPLMTVGGRIPVCGMISGYNAGGISLDAAAAPAGPDRFPSFWRRVLVNRLRVQGFIISDHFDQFKPFITEVAPHVSAGRIRYRETIAEGLESAPEAFIALLEGGNFGKQLVRVAAEA